MSFCVCGCGKEATTKDGRWAQGHWNYGKKHLDRAAPGTRIIKSSTPEEEFANRSFSQKSRRQREGYVSPTLKPCLCGCGTLVKGKWAKGHVARVNNPSSMADVKIKRSISSRKRIENGERCWAGWQKGLTKETDDRVARKGRQLSESIISNADWRQKRAESCTRQWETGRIRSLKGAEHPNWKGGVSTLQQRTRFALYNLWSRPIMKRDGFCCTRCKKPSSSNLCVHHDQERFATIMHKIVNGRVVAEMDYDSQGEICKQIVEYHLTNNTSGITLCENCHEKVHEIDKDLDSDKLW